MHTETTRTETIAAHRSGDLVTAERLYKELLRTTPSDAELLHYLGVLCYQTGRTADGVAWLRNALALAPGSLTTLQLLIRAGDETGDAEGALRALDQYLALRPDDASMLGVKGQQLVRLDRLIEAELSFRRATELSRDAAPFHDLGLCRQLLGDPAGAASAYQEAIRRGHTQPKTQLWLAQCLRATGRTREYYEAVSDAARCAPDDIELLFEAQSARRYVCDWDGFEQHQQKIAGRPQADSGVQRRTRFSARPAQLPGDRRSNYRGHSTALC